MYVSEVGDSREIGLGIGIGIRLGIGNKEVCVSENAYIHAYMRHGRLSLGTCLYIYYAT